MKKRIVKKSNSPLPHQGGHCATIYLQWTHLSFQPQVDTYLCAMCDGEFNTDWSDEEASMEFAQKFPDDDIRHAALVCDDCWIKMGLGETDDPVSDMVVKSQEGA